MNINCEGCVLTVSVIILNLENIFIRLQRRSWSPSPRDLAPIYTSRRARPAQKSPTNSASSRDRWSHFATLSPVGTTTTATASALGAASPRPAQASTTPPGTSAGAYLVPWNRVPFRALFSRGQLAPEPVSSDAPGHGGLYLPEASALARCVRRAPPPKNAAACGARPS